MDYFLFQTINGLAGKWAYLDAAGVFLAKYFGYIIGAAVFPVFWRKRRIIFQAFLAAAVSRLGMVELIRRIWERPRPFVENGFDTLTTSNVNLLLEHSDSSSFPSGHAAFFFALSAVTYFYNKKAGIVFFVASLLISVARIFTGVHWPSDILIGAIVGIISGWVVFILFQTLSRASEK